MEQIAQDLNKIFTKPICFIAHGHSLKLLDDNVEKFRDKDVDWVSLNEWKIATDILEKIGKSLTASVMYSSTYKNFASSGIKLSYSKGRGNSLREFLEQLKECSYSKPVFIFGADGYSTTDKHYYKDSSTKGGQNHKEDAEHFNKQFVSIDSFYNVNQDSFYTPIQKIGIDKCLSLL